MSGGGFKQLPHREMISSQDISDLYNGSPSNLLKNQGINKPALIVARPCIQFTPRVDEDKHDYGNENEAPIDNASLFLKTPGNKGNTGLVFDGFIQNSGNKFNVSPFFH